ncbi:hypothetical protein RUND412_000128 [Rhizina undulata]
MQFLRENPNPHPSDMSLPETSAPEIAAYFLASPTSGGQTVLHYDANRELTIGRQPSSDFPIPHPACSNTHFRIYAIIYEVHHDPLIYCEDLSLNGTYLNGRRIGKGGSVLLSHGDTLDYVPEKDKNIFPPYTITPRFLGGGAYGKVFMAQHAHTSRQLACKIISLTPATTTTATASASKRARMRAQFMREVEILKNLSHPNIITVHRAFTTVGRIYIFEDLITGGDLFSLIATRGRLEETEAMVVVWQVLKALEYLHGMGIAHRDLKPDNILCTSTTPGSRIVLTDFGAAKHFALSSSSRMTSTVGTAEYTAPEIVPLPNLPRGYTSAVDLWSLGIIVHVLLSGSTPFITSHASPPADAVLALARKCDLSRLDSTDWAGTSSCAKDFIRRLICVDPGQRLTVSGAREHRWLARHEAELESVYARAVRGWFGRGPGVRVFSDELCPQLDEERVSGTKRRGGNEGEGRVGKRTRSSVSVHTSHSHSRSQSQDEEMSLPDLIFDSLPSVLHSISEAPEPSEGSEEDDIFAQLYTPLEESLHAEVASDGRLRNAREFEMQVERRRAEVRDGERSEYFESY